MSHKLARPNQAPYFVSWVNKFLSFTPSTSLPQEAKIKQFLEHIAPRIQDWQVEQADTAIRLYLFHFIRKDTNSIDTPEADPVLTDPDVLLAKMVEILKIKHYSPKTQKSYLQWAKRFFIYMRHTLHKDIAMTRDSTDVKNFLSFLAIQQKVSASTQNQAFNALLLPRQIPRLLMRGV